MKKVSLFELGAISLIFILGTVSLLRGIGAWSFWFDESFTSMLIQYDYIEILSRTANDVHPPLFYLALKFWTSLFGTSDVALRSMSAVFMVASTGLVYVLIRKMSNYKVALIAASTVFIGPTVLRYAQEARMYGMAAFLITAASLVLYIQIHRAAKHRSITLWVLYALLIAASLYTHYFTFPIILAHWLYVLYVDDLLQYIALSKEKCKKFIANLDKRWFITNVGIVLLFLPWLPIFLRQAGSVNAGFWIEEVGAHTLTDALSQIFMNENFSDTGRIADKVWGLVVLAVVALGAWSVWRKVERSERANLILLLGPITLGMLVLFFASLMPFISSVFIVRYFTAFIVLLYAGIAYVAYLIWKYYSRQVAVVLFGCVIALMIAGNMQVSKGWGRDFFKGRDAITALKAQIEPGDEVLIGGYWRFYDSLHYAEEKFVPLIQVSGNFYGAESLIQGRSEFIIPNYSALNPQTKVVWFVSGSNEPEFSNIPANWEQQLILFDQNDFRITKYVVR